MATTLEMRAILKDEISAGLKGIEAELKKVASEGKAAGSGMSSGMSSALPSVRSVTDALGAQTAQLRAQAAAMKSAEYQKYAAEQKQIRAEIEAMTAPQQKSEKNWLSIGNAVKGFMALEVVGYLKDATIAVYNAASEMEGLEKGLIAVMGSSGAASSELEKLLEVAKLPGLGYTEAVRMSTSLQAAGMSAKMARDAMMSFGNALATVGKGKAELDGVGLALSQIMSKGKVSAEEINQIAERVPQIRLAMQAAFGTASTEMIQSMGLTSRDFIAGVTAELGKLEKVTGGMRTNSENLSDSWFEFKSNVGSIGAPVFSGVIGGLNSVIEAANMALRKLRGVNDPKIRSAEDAENARYQAAALEATKQGKAAMEAVEKEHARRVDAIHKDRASRGNFLLLQERERMKEAGIEVGKIITLEGGQQLRAVGAVNQTKKKLTEEEIKDRLDARNAAMRDEKSRIKATNADAIREEMAHYSKMRETFAGDREMLETIEAAHQSRMSDLRKKGKKEQKQDISYSTHVVLSDPSDAVAARKKRNEDDMRALALTAKAENDDAKEKRDRWKELTELARKGTDDRLKNESEVAKEAKKRREEERAEFEDDLSSRLSMHNGTLTSMLKGETDFSDGMRTMWDETGTAVINKILEMGAAWIAEQAAMLVFGTSVKAAEVGTSVAAGTAMTAAYAPAATAASIASFGGAAAAGSASMAATIPAMMAMFSYADRGGSTLVGQNRLIVGESRPEEFRKTVPGNIHNTTTNMGGVTINLHSSNPAAAGRDIQRVLRDASINNRGGSH